MSTRLDWFAVRQKSTGLLLPRATDRGNSYLEFTDKLPPRLFTRAMDAKAAMSWWVEGHCRNRGRYDEYDSFELVFTKVPGRDLTDLEVIPVTLGLPA